VAKCKLSGPGGVVRSAFDCVIEGISVLPANYFMYLIDKTNNSCRREI